MRASVRPSQGHARAVKTVVKTRMKGKLKDREQKSVREGCNGGQGVETRAPSGKGREKPAQARRPDDTRMSGTRPLGFPYGPISQHKHQTRWQRDRSTQ